MAGLAVAGNDAIDVLSVGVVAIDDLVYVETYPPADRKIPQRTKEALAARKKAGMTLGRPRGVGKSKLDPFRPGIVALLADGS